MGDATGPKLNRPKVGVGCFVTSKNYPGCILLGKRLNKDGLGTYALPGGHVEFGESFEETAIREVKEETNLIIENARTVAFVNCFRKDIEYHYLIPLVVAEYNGADEPLNTEPNKCEGWKWTKWDEHLPKPLFYGLEDIISSGFTPFSPANTMTNAEQAVASNSGKKICYFVQ